MKVRFTKEGLEYGDNVVCHNLFPRHSQTVFLRFSQHPLG